jgi:hypothetical protein
VTSPILGVLDGIGAAPESIMQRKDMGEISEGGPKLVGG